MVMGEKKQQAHKALYRKYRSKNLVEIVGQEHITRTLSQAIKKNKISHAYLFTGPKGVGKTSIARILAHEINDLSYDSEKPHLDIIEIDAASNRRIDDIRDLRDKVHIAPVSAKYKVYIIDEVHMLTMESFNALLKILEEPPAHIVFILATTEVHKLPATIVSRTQRHTFKSIPAGKIIGHLKHIAKQEGISVTDGALELLAEHGDGSFRDSISLLDQLSSSGEEITAELIETLLGVAPRENLEKLLKAIDTGKSKTVLELLQQMTEKGLTPGSISYQLIKLLRDRLLSHEPDTKYVRLINELMEVTAAVFPQLKLETALLQTAIASTGTKTTASQAEADPAEEESPQIPPQQEAASIPQPKTQKKTDLGENWQKFLNTIRTKNNSLYTILRLAKPHKSEGTLELAFGFEFHQKRASEAKHKKILTETANEVMGEELTVECVLDKTLAPSTKSNSISLEPPAHDAHASLVSDIKDIMGGGEIVHA
jgi:DNA polymerase III subunit gamma/tau